MTALPMPMPISPNRLRDRAGLQSALLQAAIAATLLLPLMLLYARGIADILLSGVAALYLLRCWMAGEWSALRTRWFQLAVVFWAWLLVTSLWWGDTPAILQAVVMGRLLLFALALEHWVLVPASARRWLLWVIVAVAAWIALESWQQYLFGANINGYPRWGDGALTGPFRKPRAGGTYLVVFFPAVLPLVMAWLARPEKWARAGGVLLLAVGVATMVLIGQRMPTLLMVLGLLVSGLLLRRFRTPMLLAMLAGALLLAATPVISPPTFQKLVLHFLEQMQHFVTSNYGLLYVRALVMLEAHPWLGLGFDGFRHACADPQYFHGLPWLGMTEQQNGGLGGCNLHPHNYYMEAATDGGFPGLLLFAALAFVLLRRIARPLGSGAPPLHAALFVAALLALWPLASSAALFVFPTSGWLFLIVGWSLAEGSMTDANTRLGRR